MKVRFKNNKLPDHGKHKTVSKFEIKIYNFLKNYFNIECQYQINNSGHHYDVFIPEFNLIIEVASLYFHPLPFKEKDKKFISDALKEGYKVIYIYWETFKDFNLLKDINKIKFSNFDEGYIFISNENFEENLGFKIDNSLSIISHNSNIHSVFPASEDTRVPLICKIGTHFILPRDDKKEYTNTSEIITVDGMNFRHDDTVYVKGCIPKLACELNESDVFDSDWLNKIKEDDAKSDVNWEISNQR